MAQQEPNWLYPVRPPVNGNTHYPLKKTNLPLIKSTQHSLGPNTPERQKLRAERNNFLTKMGRGGGKKSLRKRKTHRALRKTHRALRNRKH